MDYKGSRVLVTGASGGIGQGMAEEFAKRGANLVLVARSEDKLNQLATEWSQTYGISVDVFGCDLSVESGPDQLLQWIDSKSLQIDGLVNNAGFGIVGKFHEQSDQRNREQIMLNVYALTVLTHALLTPMLGRKKGFVINVGSIVAYQPVPTMASYGATKAFVLSFTEALWAEYKRSGIKFLAICPGATATEFFNVAGGDTALGPKRSVSDVVKTTFAALEDGRPSVVDGVSNKLNTLLPKFTTRATTVRVVDGVMKMTARLNK